MVFEHLSTIPAYEKVLEYDCKQLLTARQKSLKGSGKAYSTREALDQLHMNDNVWFPYASRRDLRPLKDYTYYSGYIEVGTYMSLYLSKKVSRQFWYIQRIPLESPQHLAYDKYSEDRTSGSSRWCHWARMFHMGSMGLHYKLLALILQAFTSIPYSGTGGRGTTQSLYILPQLQPGSDTKLCTRCCLLVSSNANNIIIILF